MASLKLCMLLRAGILILLAANCYSAPADKPESSGAGEVPAADEGLIPQRGFGNPAFTGNEMFTFPHLDEGANDKVFGGGIRPGNPPDNGFREPSDYDIFDEAWHHAGGKDDQLPPKKDVDEEIGRTGAPVEPSDEDEADEGNWDEEGDKKEVSKDDAADEPEDEGTEEKSNGDSDENSDEGNDENSHKDDEDEANEGNWDGEGDKKEISEDDEKVVDEPGDKGTEEKSNGDSDENSDKGNDENSHKDDEDKANEGNWDEGGDKKEVSEDDEKAIDEPGYKGTEEKSNGDSDKENSDKGNDENSHKDNEDSNKEPEEIGKSGVDEGEKVKVDDIDVQPFDSPFFNLRQVSKYFQQLEKAMEDMFQQTEEQASKLNVTFTNITEEEIDKDGLKYKVHTYIKKAGDNFSAVHMDIDVEKPLLNSTGSIFPQIANQTMKS